MLRFLEFPEIKQKWKLLAANPKSFEKRYVRELFVIQKGWQIYVWCFLFEKLQAYSHFDSEQKKISYNNTS